MESSLLLYHIEREDRYLSYKTSSAVLLTVFLNLTTDHMLCDNIIYCMCVCVCVCDCIRLAVYYEIIFIPEL